MNEIERRARNAARLKECWPPFAVKVQAVIRDLESHSHRPRIQDAWRSPAAQLEAYRGGYSSVKWGLHNATGKGGVKESLAVDLLDDDFPLNPKRSYLLQLASSAQAHGLITGIAWKLPFLMRESLQDAIESRYWTYPGKIGVDPTHVQAKIPLLLARLGKRPK